MTERERERERNILMASFKN